MQHRLRLLAFAVIACAATPLGATSLGTAFTYQGQLHDANAPATGLYDFQFCLFDSSSGAMPLACVTDTDNLPVEDGLFTATLDFGPVFDGQARYLELRVRPGASSGSYTTLAPRQLIRPAPEAHHATTASQAASTPWSGLTGIPAGFADGVDDAGVSSITVGNGLTGGTITSSGTIGLDATVQRRNVPPTCPAGQALQSIAQDGTPVCFDYAGQIAALQSAITTLQNQVAAIQSSNVMRMDQYVGVGAIADPNTGANYPMIYFEGVNLMITNGAGSGITNGLGNIIIGSNAATAETPETCSNGTYQDQASCEADGGIWTNRHRSGSHNLIIGRGHSYSGHSGIIAGLSNSINGAGSSITAGYRNVANGTWASISGGQSNVASGWNTWIGGGSHNKAQGVLSTISGGSSNTANGDTSAISGGDRNTTLGTYSSISGGSHNIADGDYGSSISGGRFNTASGESAWIGGGTNNQANSNFSSISGGSSNISDGFASSASGGWNNTASGDYSSISGGSNNTASGDYSSISGGENNAASGMGSSVSGGHGRHATGFYDWRAGSLFQDQ